MLDNGDAPPQEGVKSHYNSSFSVWIYLFIHLHIDLLIQKGPHSVTQGDLELMTILLFQF